MLPIYKNIVVFDFDGTLCFTADHIEGKKIWQKKTNTIFPYDGFYSKKQSLDTNVFYIPLNDFVYNKYLEAKSDPDNYVVLITGRLEKLRPEVENILKMHNLTFNATYLCTGGGTYNFKIRKFEDLISEFKPEVFTMYDDRYEHLVKFREWALTQPCEVHIIDVTKSDKTPDIYNHKN